MRLLNTKTGEFVWVEDPRQEHYAILSHVWARPSDPGYVPEQIYEGLLRLQEDARADSTLPIFMFPDKLRRFCETALNDGFKLGWADTCCIDKTSSSELSEAINSMYSWYAYSGACYAFLHDVDPPNASSSQKWETAFKRSVWFRRGWTLQELIAPRIVIFVSKGWEALGTKHGLAACISSVTNIDTDVLTFEKSLEKIPIARRMAWMQCRETTRLEDEAYCLMGIFSVSMPTNYGEGRYAFIRLQEKILSQSPDQSIFAWGSFLDEPLSTLLPPRSSLSPYPSLAPSPLPDPQARHFTSASFPGQYLLASSSKEFNSERSANLVWLSREEFRKRLGLPVTEDLYQVFEITPYGLRTHFPLLGICSPDQARRYASTHCAVLACEDLDKGLLALLLRPGPPLSSDHEFFAGATVVPQRDDIKQSVSVGEAITCGPLWDHYYRLVYITQEELQMFLRRRTSTPSASSISQPITGTLPRVTVSVVYIPHCPSRSAFEQNRDSNIHSVLCETFRGFTVQFCRLSMRMLKQDGYNVSLGQDGPLSEHMILTSTPSSASKSIVTIWDNLTSGGVYLTVQVGRCTCDMGRRNGLLSVLVSSRGNDSLDRKYSLQDPDHIRSHPLHVYSWSFDHGSASRQIDFDSPNPNDARRLSLRLVLTSIAPSPGKKSAVQHYRLSAELRKREDSEVPRPKQQLLLNPTSSAQSPTRMRANSSPPMPTTAPNLVTPSVASQAAPSKRARRFWRRVTHCVVARVCCVGRHVIDGDLRDGDLRDGDLRD